MKTKLQKYLYIFLPLILGSIIGFIIKDYINYFDTLKKPPLYPPKILFPIIWSIIYLLIGISYNIIKNKNKSINIIYYSQLIVNLLWSIIFFILKWNLLSLIWIILLDILVIITIILFKKDNKTSFFLLLPYLIWNLYATYLTTGIYFLN